MKQTTEIRIFGRQFSINIILLGILLCGLLFKVIYLYSYSINSPFYRVATMDAAVYVNWAQLINEEGWLGKEAFYRAPFYPYLLSIIFYTFSKENILAIYISQLVMGLCAVVLIYHIGKRIYNERAGLIAACFMLAYAPLTFFETKILPTVTGTFLGLIFLYLLTRAEQEKKWYYWMGGAAALGFASICRPTYILMIPLIILSLIILYRNQLREMVIPILFLVLIPSVTIGTVTLRNLAVSKDVVLVSANAGITFAQGNNPWARGSITILPGFSGEVTNQRQEETHIAERVMGRKLKPSEINEFWFRWGVNFIREQPLKYLKLLLYKTALLFNNHELGNNYLLSADQAVTPCLKLALLPFGFIMAWAALGLASIFLERRAALALTVTFVGSAFMLILFYVNSRYRMSVAAPAIIMAGGGLDYLLRNRRQSILAIFLVGIICVISLPPFMPLSKAQLSRSHSRIWAQLGGAYIDNKQLEEALWAYEKAIDMEPSNYSYCLTKVSLLKNLGHSKGEITRWAQQVASRISPDDYRELIIAEALYAVDDYHNALDYVEKIILSAPDDYKLYLHSGILYGKMGRHLRAKEAFSKGLVLNPQNIDLQYNYTVACLSSGDNEEAMRWARKIVLNAPYFDKARRLLEHLESK